MKLHTLALAIFILSILNIETSKAQSILLNKKIDFTATNLEVDVALKKLFEQENIDFAYNSSDFNIQKRVSISLKNESIEKVVRAIFPNENILLKEVNNQVVIVKDKNASANLQNDKLIMQVIKGIILDKESKTPLIGANIILLNGKSNTGVTSDVDGKFKLIVPVGRVNLKTSYVGYEDFTISELLVIAGKESFLTIEMRENVSTMQEVIVKVKTDKTMPVNSMASISARMISTEDANRYAAGYSDPARMVSSFAGVVPAEGDKNNVIIRGNSSRGLLWRLEGIEIPNPSHFSDGQGDSGGSFCIVSSSTLSNSDFYTGAFPAEYGNATSGILDLNYRKGNPDKYEIGVQAGVVGTEASLEGPIKGLKGSSFMINYRYSNFKWLSELGLLNTEENRRHPYFQDLALNVNIPTIKAGTFSLFGLGGMSTTGKFGIKDSSRWFNESDLRTDEIEFHSMGILGLKHAVTLANKKTYIKTIVATTEQYDRWDMGYLITGADNWHKGNFPAHTYSRFRFNYNTFSYPSIRMATTVNHKFNANHTIRTGMVFNVLNFNMYYERYNFDSSHIYNQPVIDVFDNAKGTTYSYEAFLQWKYRITEKLEMNSGIHGLLFALNGHYSVEPRFGLKWQLTEKSFLTYGLGIHSKIESVSAYYSKIIGPDGKLHMLNKNVDFTRALHNVIGYDCSILPDLRLKVELYHQYLYNVPVEDNPISTNSAINGVYGVPDVVFTNKGYGKNKGVEVTLEKFYSNKYYFLVTASVFDSKYKASDGHWYNTYFNNKLITNCLAGKDFMLGPSKQNVISANVKVLVMGGYRYSPIDLNLSQGDDEYYIPFKTFANQTSTYFRFDLGVKYRRNMPSWSYIISLDVQNITDRKNVMGYDYNYNSNTGQKWLEPIEGLGMVPIINFRVEF